MLISTDTALAGLGFAGLAFTLTYLQEGKPLDKLLVVAPSSHVRYTTGLLTSKAAEWFQQMGLEHVLENSLAKPAVTDLIYVMLSDDVRDCQKSRISL